MLKFLKIISCLFFSCLFLFGCATSTSRSVIDESKTSSIKSIAVVSLLGDDFHSVKIGLTVFNNEFFESNVSSWAIDQFAEREILQFLGEKQKYSGKSLVHDSKLSSEFLEQSKNIFSNRYSNVINLARSQGADVLVLVEPASSSNAPLLRPGYGFFESNKPPFSSIRAPYFSATVRVISVKEGESLAWRWMASPGIDQTIKWKGALENYSAKEVDQIKSALLDGLKKSLHASMREMGL